MAILPSYTIQFRTDMSWDTFGDFDLSDILGITKKELPSVSDPANLHRENTMFPLGTNGV
ncbi:hypothetical protein PAT3040_02541 [Paenibacillus agaridevorans]|uniref:Uncharacterized protein n=1 Tax=Paenibacillus agaridevorans TaxID=171404 RepID=A0A2R5EMR7_9BACL|nr:hypothetical protein PAT3040_02541 [Paenibacillus agaridevorans]